MNECKCDCECTTCKTMELGDICCISQMENGKAFLKDALCLTGCEISVNCLPAMCKVPFCHKHRQNEEVYIFLKGEGKMWIDDCCVWVKEGSCVKVDPCAKRTLENCCDCSLEYICVQAKAGSLEQCGMTDAELC